MKMTIKKDWWLANSIFWIASGLLVVINYLIIGSVGWGSFSGGINILIGVALLQRSKIAFWISLVFASYSFLSQILNLSNLSKQTGNFSLTLQFVVSLVIFVMALMLWQQIRREKKQ